MTKHKKRRLTFTLIFMGIFMNIRVMLVAKSINK